MLGIFFAPEGNSTVHIERMCQKGHDWVDRVKARPLQPSDAWLSFMYQVFPGMSWGLVTAVISPGPLRELLHKVYYKALPLLGIQRLIKDLNNTSCLYEILRIASFVPSTPLSAKCLVLGFFSFPSSLLP